MDDDFLFVERLDPYRSICISALARATLEDSDMEGANGDSGFYIYEACDGPMVSGIFILAKVASFEAALRLIDIWRDRAVTQQSNVAA